MGGGPAQGGEGRSVGGGDREGREGAAAPRGGEGRRSKSGARHQNGRIVRTTSGKSSPDSSARWLIERRPPASEIAFQEATLIGETASRIFPPFVVVATITQ